MICSSCNCTDSRVVESRSAQGGVRRLRECLNCSKKYVSFEYQARKVKNRWFPTPDYILDLLDEYEKKTRDLEEKIDAISNISSEIKEIFTYQIKKLSREINDLFPEYEIYDQDSPL